MGRRCSPVFSCVPRCPECDYHWKVTRVHSSYRTKIVRDVYECYTHLLGDSFNQKQQYVARQMPVLLSLIHFGTEKIRVFCMCRVLVSGAEWLFLSSFRVFPFCVVVSFWDRIFTEIIAIFDRSQLTVNWVNVLVAQFSDVSALWVQIIEL